jgi:sugar/nucleoside kinase (ribokinase family)
MPFDVAVVGEINADLILSGNVDPAFGQVEQLVDEANLVIGSSAAIFACGLARLGLKTTILGKIGNDMFGRFMVESLNAKNVDTSGVIVDPNIPTGLTVILAKKEDRAILTHMGSIPAMRFSDIDFSLIDCSRHLHLGSFFLLDNLRPEIPKLFHAARNRGLSISMDPNYDPTGRWNSGLNEAAKLIDILLPNAREAKAIAGEDNLDNAMDKLTQTVPLLAVKLGRQGAMCKCTPEKTLMQGALPVEVVDTVGAGDCFDAGFVYGYLNKWDLTKTLKLAVCCGSLSTRKAGGTEAQADLSEAMKFIKKSGQCRNL